MTEHATFKVARVCGICGKLKPVVTKNTGGRTRLGDKWTTTHTRGRRCNGQGLMTWTIEKVIHSRLDW